MRKINNLKKYLLLFSLAILFFALTFSFFLKNISLKKLIDEKPTEIIVTNISTLDAQIYWKTTIDNINNIYYKESSDTGLFKEIEYIQSYEDTLTNQRVNVIQLSSLEPNTEYLFRIESEHKMWDNNYSFKTKAISETINLPNIITGNGNDRSFLLVDIEGNKYMLNTQYHGTWAFDSQGKEYTIASYANYISINELQSRLNNLLVTPIYAESGANCKINVKVSNYPYAPSKAKTIDILNRWVAGCNLGGYPDECYEDVYCKALEAGVDPAFAITIWSNESGGSNYAYSSQVEDFGIHGLSSVPVRDFQKQADYFLNNIASESDSYIAGCTSGDKVYAWGAKFLTGNCTTAANIDKGRVYMTGISQVYSWYTNNSLTWPFIRSSSASTCNYSNAYANTTYNSCTSKSTPTSNPQPLSSPTISASGGDGSKDYMVVTGTGVTPKDRDCKDADGCICLYGYVDSKAESTLTISNGYTCTVDKRVIVTPNLETKVCCLANNSLSFIPSTNCNGSVLEGVNESNCKTENKTVSIKAGVNFIEALYIVNKEQVPIHTAKSLISYSDNKILAVGLFRSDRWEKIVKNENGVINGEDFNLDPGESYLVIAVDSIDIPVKSMKTEKVFELNKLIGWNLIPSSIFKNVSSNSKSILQNTQYTYINQIALWNNDMNIFDYTLRDNSGEIYGDSLSILNQQGFFIKIPQ